MDLLYVLGQFPKLSESFIINEIHELDKRGHNVSVFARDRPDEDITHEEIDEMNITVHYGEEASFRSIFNIFSRKIFNPTILRQATFIDPLHYHAYYLYLGKQIIEAIESENGVDHIHAHFADSRHLAVTYAAAYYDISCTVTAHAKEIFATPNVRRLHRVCSRFDHIIVPSEYNKQYLRKNIGVNKAMTVVPATMNTEKFEPTDECIPNRLLTVARLVEKKGHEYAIDAVANLINKGYNIEYHIVGTGKRREFLQNRVREYGIEENVKFLYHISDKHLREELHNAEVFVLPCVVASDGDRDVAPVALKEAMATQTACISTTVSAIPELITHRENGLLVEPHNSHELSNKIEVLLSNDDCRKQLAKEGRKTVESRLDISSIVDDLFEVFEDTKQKDKKTSH